MMRDGLDEGLPWEDYMAGASPLTEASSSFTALQQPGATVGSAAGPSVALRTGAGLMRGPASDGGVVRAPAHRAAWTALVADEDAMEAHTYELRTRPHALGITVYDHPDAEAEFWRYVFWRFRWEPPGFLFGLGLACALQLTGDRQFAVVAVAAFASAALLVSALAFAVVVYRVQGALSRQRLFMTFTFFPVLGIIVALTITVVALALQGAHCPYGGRFTSQRTICLRQIPSNFATAEMLAVLLIRRIPWAASILIGFHVVAMIAFALSPDYTAVDVGLFGGLGLVLIGCLLGMVTLLEAQQRRQFQHAVQLMLSLRDFQKQSLAIATIAKATLPSRVGARLNRTPHATAPELSLRDAQTDSCSNCFAVAVEVRRFLGWHAGDVLRMIRSAHSIFATLDVIMRDLRLDHAGITGDTYLVTSGLHGARDDASVAAFIANVARSFPSVSQPLCDTVREVTIAISASVGAARAEFVGTVGVRFCVTGPAISTAILNSRCAPDGSLWMTRPAAAALTLIRADFGCGEECEGNTQLWLNAVGHVPVGVCNSPMQATSTTSRTVSPRGSSSPLEEGSIREDPRSLLLPALTLTAQHTDSAAQGRAGDGDAPEQQHTIAADDLPTRDSTLAASSAFRLTWYGAFADQATEAAFVVAAARDVDDMLPPTLLLKGLLDCAIALIIGVEQAVDSELAAKTEDWRLVTCLAVFLGSALFAFCIAAFVRFRGLRIAGPAVVAAIFLVTLSSWVPVPLMPENIFANRPQFTLTLTVPAMSLLLQRLPWTLAALYLMLLGALCLGFGHYTSVVNPGAAIGGLVMVVTACIWCARLSSLQARLRFADVEAASQTAARIKAFAHVLRAAITSTFPRHCIRDALEALAEPSNADATRSEERWGNLALAFVSFADIDDATGRVARVIGDAVNALPPEVAIVQAAGHELTLASGFDDPARGCVPLVDFLRTLRDSAQAVGCAFVAGLAVEEAEGALVGRSDALRFHLVGPSTRIVRGLVAAYPPVPLTPPVDSAFLLTTAFIMWHEYGLMTTTPMTAASGLGNEDESGHEANPLQARPQHPTAKHRHADSAFSRDLAFDRAADYFKSVRYGLTVVKLRGNSIGLTKVALLSRSSRATDPQHFAEKLLPTYSM